MIADVRSSRSPGSLPMMEVSLLVLALAATAAGAVATARLGLEALGLPLLAGAGVLAITAPHRLALVLLAASIVIEPGAIDATRHLAPLIYELPAGVALPFTTTPLELAILGCAISVALRGGWTSRLRSVPLLGLAVLAAMLFGAAFGMYRGGASNLAFNEARGLIYGSLAFLIALTAPASLMRPLGRVLLVATGALALIVLWRYFAYIRPGDYDVPLEFAFAHENSIMLGVGLAIGLTSLARSGLSLGERLLLMVYCIVVLLALAATQRRAATLVGLVGVMVVAGMLFRHRPVAIIAISVPVLLGATMYLGAYWDREYGTLAQPARAVRSQIDPNPRDEASDAYRDIEYANVVSTLEVNRIFGIGFGRPFAQFEPLPDLEAYWPLQSYTPHQNILWLWLKMGLAGLAAFLGLIAIALGRSIAVVRNSRSFTDLAAVAVVVAATLLMYLAFATVDIALVGARGILLLAVAMGVAFAAMPTDPREKQP